MPLENIPKKIHYVWVGSVIPEKYWRSICNTAYLSYEDGFEVFLWAETEKFQNFDKRIKQSILKMRYYKIIDILKRFPRHPLLMGGIIHKSDLTWLREKHITSYDDSYL